MKLSWECDAGASIFHAGSNVGLRGQVIPERTLDICAYCERVVMWIKDGGACDWLHFEGQITITEWP